MHEEDKGSRGPGFTVVSIKEMQILVDHSDGSLVREEMRTVWSVFSRLTSIHFNE